MSRPDIPILDESILSPSGHCSKRARAAALKRVAAELFPPGYWDKPAPTDADRRAALLRSAANLRELAARGMSTRRYLREAARLESEAAS